MRKPKRWIVLSVTAVAIIGLYVFLSFGSSGDSAEAKYQHYLRTMRFGGKLRRAAMRLPSFLGRPVDRYASRCWDSVHMQERLLFTSGYLTNISVVLPGPTAGTSATPSVDEIDQRVHAAVPDNSFLPCSLVVASNRVWVEVSNCRTQDVVRLEKALTAF
jgi:hypothetical protein